ncbi:MAG: dihydroorotase [Alphaproteobacteria bacterium]
MIKNPLRPYPRHVNTKPLLITNARLFDPESGFDQLGGLLVENGRIAQIGDGVSRETFSSESDVIDAKGCLLSPGLIDARVHLSEPGAEYKEPISETTAAAAAGGITSLAGLPNTQPVIDDTSILQYIARRAREAKMCKVYAYGAITKGMDGQEMCEIGLMQEAGAVGFSDGNQAIADAKVMMRALSYSQLFDSAIHSFPSYPGLGDGDMNSGWLATRLGLSGINPLAEVMLVERDLRLLETAGGRLHFGPVTTAKALAAIRKAKDEGLNVTCSTCPHYFTLTETVVGAYRTFGKVYPPLRSDADRDAVEAAIADGTIDLVVSDHRPQDSDSKRLPFAQAEPGIVGIETLLPLTLKLYHSGLLDLKTCLGLLTHKPADLLGIPAGRLKLGAAADLTLIDLNLAHVIKASDLTSRCKNLAFETMPSQGKAILTIVDGRIVHQV